MAFNDEADRRSSLGTRGADQLKPQTITRDTTEACEKEVSAFANQGAASNEHHEEFVRRQRNALLDDLFSYHPPRGDQTQRYRAIRTAARNLAEVIWDNAPACEDRSGAINQVRAAVMLANAAIALDGRL